MDHHTLNELHSQQLQQSQANKFQQQSSQMSQISQQHQQQMSMKQGMQIFQGSQMQTKKVNLSANVCEEHGNEAYTNYCTCLECLRPLCPECIDDHTKLHLSRSSVPEITSLRQVKTNCQKKLNAAIFSLNKEIETCELSYLFNPQQIIDTESTTLKKCKERVIHSVTSFFDGMEEQLRRKVQENVIKAQDFSTLFEKMKNLISELDYLGQDLRQEHPFENVRKVCLLDLKQVMDKFKSEIHKLIQQSDLEPVKIHVDENRYSQLRRELERLLFLSASDQIQNSYVQSQLLQNDSVAGGLSGVSPQRAKTTGGVIQKSIAVAGAPQLAIQNEVFRLTVKDTFDETAPRKYLHFFQNDENKLFMLNLYELKYNKNTRFEQIFLNIDFRIPIFHKSISISNGNLYLIGGTFEDEHRTKCPHVYQFDFTQNSLIPISNLVTSRSSHAICYLNNQIYIVGGFGPDQMLTNKCEKFDVKTSKCISIAGMNYPTASFCITAFGNNAIYKFGGVAEGQLSSIIEKYEVQRDIWIQIDPRLTHLPTGNVQFKLLSTASCVQINEFDIFVFGGYNEDNSGSSQTFLLTIEQNVMNQQQQDSSTIRCINWKPLPYSEAFWNNCSVVFEGELFVLQNVSDEKNEDCLEDVRRILKFDSKEWKSLN